MSTLNIIYRGSRSTFLSHAELENNFTELENRKVVKAGSIALFRAGPTSLRDSDPQAREAGNFRINTDDNICEWYSYKPGDTKWERINQNGYTGSGAIGYNGSVGDPGSTGAGGDQGPQGYTGSRGPTGATGAQGPKGPNGIQGPQGPQGPAGSIPSNAAKYVQTNTGSPYSLFFNTTNTEIGTSTNSNVAGLVLHGDGFVRSSTSGGPNLSIRRDDNNGTVLGHMLFGMSSFNANVAGLGINVAAGVHGFLALASSALGNTVCVFYTTSDYRSKYNLKIEKNLLNKLANVDMYNFNYIGKPKIELGFIAHEAAKEFPFAVSGEKDEVDKDGNPKYQQMDYKQMVPVLVGAVNELSDKIKELKSWLQ